MMFQNPSMLAWLGAAALPVLVHLLTRARYRTVPWGAMMFLVGADAPTQQSARLKQWALLALRTLFVSVIVIALARPVATFQLPKLPSAGLNAGGTAAVVLILDDSAAMGYTRDGVSRADDARRTAMQILAVLGRGDQAAILFPSASGSANGAAHLSGDLQSLVTRVADYKPAFGISDMAAALMRGSDLLAGSDAADREIDIVCGRQESGWRNVNDAFAKTWHARFGAGNADAPTPPPRLNVFAVGGEESDNVAIESVRALSPPVIRDQPTQMEVRIRNFGPTPRAAVQLSIYTAARTVAQTTVPLPANSSRAVRLNVKFNESGPLIVSAAIQSTGLTSDDRLDCAINISEPIPLLIIDGDETNGPRIPPHTQAGFIRLAACPFATLGRPGPDPAAVTMLRPSDWTVPTLSKYAVVILVDVPKFTIQQARELEQFAFDGGGILICPGDRVQIDSYDDLLYRGGGGILPASLSMPVNVNTAIGRPETQGGPFQFLADREDLLTAQIHQIFPASPRGPDASVLARTAMGQPLVIESPTGRGRVVLMTAALDEQWSSLPRTDLFLPLVQSSVRYLASAGTDQCNIALGDPIVATISGVVEEKSATVQQLPGGHREPASMTAFEDHSEIRYSGAKAPGPYRLRYRVGGRDKYANYIVSPPPEASDLTPMTDTAWNDLASRAGFHRVTAEDIPEVVAANRGRREMWVDLLGVAVALAVLEMGLSRWWSR